MSSASSLRGSRLPLPLTPFVGRKREVEAAAALLLRHDVRLLTLTGPGGVGKTRLALRIVETITPQVAGDSVFVDLSAVADAALVPATIARALDIRTDGEQPLLNRLVTDFRDRHLLLVLDNVELVVAAAPVVADLLHACPRFTVLATGRVPLHVGGEQLFAVQPLPLPAPDQPRTHDDLATNDAVVLFVLRARSAMPDFALTESNAPVVAEICHRLDGLPLAIELAAARSSVLSPAALLTRLDHPLPLLTGGPRDQPVRLQTMRDAIAWSYDLLTAEEQCFFRRLAVFTGGFTLEAAGAVAGDGNDVLDGISALVGASLLQPHDAPVDMPRYRMLETIRQYALEQLAASGESEEIHARHAAYVLALSEIVMTEMTWREQRHWKDRMEQEHDNLRAVLGRAIARRDVDTAQRLVAAVWIYFWLQRGYRREGRMWVERALALGPGSSPRASAAVVRGAIGLAGERPQSVAFAREALARARAIRDDLLTAMALYFLAFALTDCEAQDHAVALDEAEALYEEAVAMFDHGDGMKQRRQLAASATHNLSVIADVRGDLDRAEVLRTEAVARWRESGIGWGTAGTLSQLAALVLTRGEPARAASLAQQALAVSWEMGDTASMVDPLEVIASAVCGFCAQGELVARLWGATDALSEAIGHAALEGSPEEWDRAEVMVRDTLGEDAFRAALAAGRTMPLEQVVAEALAIEPESLALETVPDEVATPGSDHGLTPRELEVVRLIAAGRSNQEIADALFVSHNTAITHVRHIFNKLGLHSRTAVATWAIRHGLA